MTAPGEDAFRDADEATQKAKYDYRAFHFLIGNIRKQADALIGDLENEQNGIVSALQKTEEGKKFTEELTINVTWQISRLEEARKIGKLERFAKEHPSESRPRSLRSPSRRYVSRRSLEAEETSLRERDAEFQRNSNSPRYLARCLREHMQHASHGSNASGVDQKPSRLLVWCSPRTHSSARMIDRAVLVAEPRQLRVGFQFVRRDRRALTHVLDDVGLKRYARRTLATISRHHVAVGAPAFRTQRSCLAPRDRACRRNDGRRSSSRRPRHVPES